MTDWAPLCMEAGEWDDWRRLNPRLNGTNYAARPCVDCPTSFARQMLAISRCNGAPEGDKRWPSMTTKARHKYYLATRERPASSGSSCPCARLVEGRGIQTAPPALRLRDQGLRGCLSGCTPGGTGGQGARNAALTCADGADGVYTSRDARLSRGATGLGPSAPRRPRTGPSGGAGSHPGAAQAHLVPWMSPSPPNGYVTYRELNAETKRLDDLRAVEVRRMDDLRKMESDYTNQLSMAESRRLDAVMTAEARRIDANRSTDVAAVILANARAELTAAALAERVDTSAKTLVETVAATAKAAAIETSNTSIALGGRIKPLEDARYEQAGRRGGASDIGRVVYAIVGLGVGLISPLILLLSGHLK